MKRMNISKEIKELAKKIHRAEHIFVEGSIKANHKLEDYYYLLGSFVVSKILDKIEYNHIDLYNEIVDLGNKFNELSKQMKEISKQQKYLWQTLELKQEQPK